MKQKQLLLFLNIVKGCVMKKIAIILTLACVLFFVAVSVSSAADTKEEYYREIESILLKIEENLMKGDRVEAQKWASELRACVYRCARFLAQINEYDSRIMMVINLAEQAFKGNDVHYYIIGARDTAALVLLGKINNGDEGDSYGSSHS